MNYKLPFGSADREDGFISVNLLRGFPTLPPVPVELQSFISPQEWERRLDAINSLAHRYSKPIIERIWIFMGFLLTLTVPIALYHVLGDDLPRLGDSDNFFQEFARLKLIVLGVFIGTLVVVWTPLILWKCLGRYRMRKLLNEWGKIDILAKNKGLFVPLWNVYLPSSFSQSITVRISIPPRVNPSAFHPDAYLPPYIAPPNYLPGYTGYNQGTAFQDVKVQDVKV